jgi:hypothetical protein
MIARIVGVLLLLSLVSAQTARACSRIAARSVQNLTTLPLDGSPVPRNTRLWTIALPTDEGEFVLTDARGGKAVLQRSTILINGEQPVNLEILTPVSLLEPGSWTFTRGTTVLSQFTVLDEVDEVAPASLTPTISNVDGEYFGAYSCGNPALVMLALGAEAEIAIAAMEGESWQVATALGVASGSTLHVTAPAAGDHRMVVFHVDLAGNATASPVVTAKVPAKTSGCSVGPVLPLGLVALALLRRRATRTTLPACAR